MTKITFADYQKMSDAERTSWLEQLRKKHHAIEDEKLQQIRQLMRQNLKKDNEGKKEHDRLCWCKECQKKLKGRSFWDEYYFQNVKKGFQDAF